MTTNTLLVGFTLENGTGGLGGGVHCENLTNSIVSNCIIISNVAYYGGGVSGGTVNDSLIASNSALVEAGGVYLTTLNRCVVKGNVAPSQAGAIGNWNGETNGYRISLNDCTLIGNSTPGSAGGADNDILNNCLLIGNQAAHGGGALACKLYNCTVVSNSAAVGAGVELCITINSIVYYNNGPNIDPAPSSTVYTCTPSLLPGVGNFTSEPLFVNPANGDFHLQSNSPCINSGNNSLLTITNNFTFNPAPSYLTFMTNDLDGNPRIAGGTVDVGAYEFQSPTSVISYAWLQQYGFPTDGSADHTDPDTDGMNNWQEWRAGTIPTDSTSLLQMLMPMVDVSGTTLTWQSQTNVTYFLQRSSSLSTPFSTIQSNIVGQVGTTSCADTNAAASGSFFYRVGVQ